MNDAHAHVFATVCGRTRNGPTRSLTYGRIQHGNQVQQLLSPQNRETCYPVEMLIANMDLNGIERAMLLQGPFYGTTNAYQAEALRTYPDRLWGALYFDPWADAPAALQELVDTGLYRALKLECTEPTGLGGLHLGMDLGAPDLAWIWSLLQREGLTLTLDLGAPGSVSYQTAAVAGIAQQHPDLRILIAHLGQPNAACLVPGLQRDRWWQQLDLGLLPNVWFDCAALPAYFPEEEYPYPSAVTCMREALAHLGPKKMLWGTDQPGLLQHLSLRQLVQQAHHYATDLNEAAVHCFLQANFAVVYGAI